MYRKTIPAIFGLTEENPGILSRTLISIINYDITAELFENWFKTKLLPIIQPNSVIVMEIPQSKIKYYTMKQLLETIILIIFYN